MAADLGLRDTDRYERERAFHDERYEDDPRQTLGRYYRAARTSRAAYRSLIACDREDVVLEFGCGTGSAAFDLAPTGAPIIGIDISPVVVGQARAAATQAGFDNLTFEEMNAERLDLDDRSIDLVCGTGILHHLDVGAAYAEVTRVLRPGGRAVFLEPLGHNPLINLYRRLTPEMRTEDEHPLERKDLRLARHFFSHVRIQHHHLAAVGVSLLDVDRPVGRVALAVADRFDRLALRIPGVRDLAWIAVMDLRGPLPR